MRRILSFHGFNFVLLLGIGFTTDCICAYTALDYLQQELIRENPSARQGQTNPARHNKNPWKEQIRRIWLSVIDFEYGETAEGERAHQWGTVFQTVLPYFLNTRDFVPGYSRFARYCLPDKTSYNQQPDNKTTRQQNNLLIFPWVWYSLPDKARFVSLSFCWAIAMRYFFGLMLNSHPQYNWL